MNEPLQNPESNATNPASPAGSALPRSIPIQPKNGPTASNDERFQSGPMERGTGLFVVAENLLRYPGRIIYEIHKERAATVAASLSVLSVICVILYGLVVGALRGGTQIWIAPAKILLGSSAAALICLPSLYIFLCLRNSKVSSFAQITSALLAAICLIWILMIGFAPIAWVFSQSTDSVLLMTVLHLIFWSIAVTFGMRLLDEGTRGSGAESKGSLKAWVILYVVVNLQMITALRPVIGTAESILPKEKQFFVAHALSVLADEFKTTPKTNPVSAR